MVSGTDLNRSYNGFYDKEVSGERDETKQLRHHDIEFIKTCQKFVCFKDFLKSIMQRTTVMSRIERSYEKIVKFVVEFNKKSQILLHMQLKRKIAKFVKFVIAFDPGHK